MNEIIDNRAENEFELEVDGLRAVAAYQLDGDTIAFTHTLVPKKLEGRGVGSKLIRGALDSARDRGLKVVPLCSFVKVYVDRHPEYRELVKGG